jgi:hypothetical protein
MTLPVNLRPVNEEVWLNSQVGPYAVCGNRSVARIDLSPRVSVFQYQSVSAPYLYFFDSYLPCVNLKFDRVFKQLTYSQIIPVLYST